MDFIVLTIDILVILLFIGLLVLVSPYMMRFLMKRDGDIFVQLIPVFALTFLGSVVISLGYGGFQETMFFRLTAIISFILLASVLFLTLMMKKLWKENYEHLLIRIPSFHKKKELSLRETSR